MTEKLITIRTLEGLETLKAYLADKDLLSFDSETDGVEKDSRIIGFSVSADISTGYYVILSYWDVASQQLIELETMRGAKDFMEFLATKDLVLQNATFDCDRVENNFQVKLMHRVVHDTMIGGHLLNENRSNGLKQRCVELYGEDETREQAEMKESVTKNGGMLTKDKYELYKADCDLIAKYGAKDAIQTLKLFFHDTPLLFQENLDKFFYNDESMPLLRGPTYEMNTTGLRVDPERLQSLRRTLEAECMEDKAFIEKEVFPSAKVKYPGTGKTNHFNINAPQQRAWLLFEILGNEFHTLTKSGREMCKALDLKVPYAAGDKREFIRVVTSNMGRVYEEAKLNPKTKKMVRPKTVGDPWKYMSCGKETMGKMAPKYKWCERFLVYNKNLKILNTYVEGIQSKMRYNIIRPSFLQHGTTSGRYASRRPNFQNLPRDDKRVKACIVSRPGKVFVGADYEQLEPRVFASYSQDERLMKCFSDGDDFYSVIGAEVFDKAPIGLKKDDPNGFAKRYPKLRDIAKVVALSATYGTTAFRLAPAVGKTTDETQEVINDYFIKFPGCRKLQENMHRQVKTTGVVHSLFGRPRRIARAMDIDKLFGNVPHHKLDYAWRNLLNLSVNHPIQSTGATIMNRAAIAVWDTIQALALEDPRWFEVKIVLQCHDELVLEAPEALAEAAALVLKDCMENATILPGVALVAEPIIGRSLAELK